jgi:uncharacterized membrane protein
MTAHLFIVHFPVSLIFIGALLDIIGHGIAERDVRRWAGRLFMMGAAAAFLAFATGENAKLVAIGAPSVDLMQLQAHQQWGSVGAWGLAIAGALRALWRERLDGLFGWLNLAIVIAGSGIVLGITLTGTLIRHGQ